MVFVWSTISLWFYMGAKLGLYAVASLAPMLTSLLPATVLQITRIYICLAYNTSAPTAQKTPFPTVLLLR
jgi:hypothetical protein